MIIFPTNLTIITKETNPADLNDELYFLQGVINQAVTLCHVDTVEDLLDADLESFTE